MAKPQPLLSRWQQTINRATDLSAADAHVALVLSTHMDYDGGKCYPSMRTVAAESKRKTKTVAESIRRLDSLGYLVVKRSPKPSKKNGTSSNEGPVSRRGYCAVPP